MKIIYSSTYLNSREDIFLPSDSRVGLNEYTFTHIFNGLEHSYDFSNYLPGYDFCKWLSIHEDGLGLIAKDRKIEISEAHAENVFMAINSRFEKIDFFGLKEFDFVGNYRILNNKVVKAYPYGDDSHIHFELYDDLTNPPIATIKDKYEGYRTYLVHKMGLVTIERFQQNKIDIDFYNDKFEHGGHKELKIIGRPEIYEFFIKDNKLYISSRPFCFFCVCLESYEVLWMLELDWCYQVMTPSGVHPENYGHYLCIQARDEGRWALVDLDTGKIVQDVNIKLSEGIYFPPQGPGCLTYGYRSFYCEGFVFVEFSTNLLVVYDAKTGRKLHEIACPNEFSFLAFMGFKSDCFYFYLKHSASAVFIPYSGVLIIPREELLSQEPLKLELEDKGDIHHNIIPDGEFESYEVVASYDNMGDALRFIQIEMNTIVCLHSYTHYSQGTSLWKLYVNQKFNGKVTIKIDRDKLKDRDDRKFDQMVSLYNEYYQEISFAPIGAKLKRPVHAQVTWEYF